MWINPNHPDRERLMAAANGTAADATREAPEDKGRRLATLPRGRTEELRVSLDEYEGKRFVHLRVWARGADGRHYPTRKGCSVRLHELAEVAGALALLAEELDAEPPAPRQGRRSDVPSGVPRAQAGRREPAAARTSAVAPWEARRPGPADGEFDEFA